MRVGIDQRRERHVDGPRDVSGSGVVVAIAPVNVRGQGIDDADLVSVDGGEHLLLADEEVRADSDGEGDRWPAGLGVGGDRAAVGGPPPPPSVEHGGVIKTQRSEHPPHPGGPHVHERVVEDDPGAVTNAECTHHGAELTGRWKHEREGRGRVGDLVDEVDMRRSGNMVPLPRRLAGPVAATAVRQNLHRDRAIEHAQVGHPQLLLQPGATHEPVHRSLLPSHAGAARSAPADHSA